MPRKQKVPSRARLSILHLAAPLARFAVALFLVMNLFRPLAAQLPERRVVTGVIRLDTNNVLSIIVEETTAYAHKGSQIDVILNSSTEVDTVGYRRVAISGVRRYRRASVYFGVEGGHNIALKVTVYDPLDASTSQEASFQQAREGISRSGVTAQDIQFGRNTANSSVKLLNQYWEERFRDAGYKYVPPRFVFYLGATTTGCDPPGEVRGPEFAFYCPADRTVYYEESSMAVLAGSVAKTFASDAHDAVTLTLGHEWGHAIHHELESQPGIRKPTAKTLQIRFGRFENPNYSGPSIDVDATIASEREADCLAGAFSAEMMRASGLHGSTEWLNQIQDGGSEGNKECLLRAYTSYWGPDRSKGPANQEFYRAINACVTTISTPDAHGNLEDRMGAFNRGRQTSLGSSSYSGPFKCGPLVNAWLARSPTKKLHLATYCSEQFPGIRRPDVRTGLLKLSREGRLPLQYLSIDIFCLEDALANVTDH